MKTNRIEIDSSGKPLTGALAEAAALSLATLFAYTAVSKVYDWGGTRMAMYNQVFPVWIADIILFGLPVAELAVAVLLLVPGLRKIGLLSG